VLRYLLVMRARCGRQFPCNQFGEQEPASNAEIASFAQAKGASFPLFSKSTVKKPRCRTEAGCLPSSSECCAKNNVVYDFLVKSKSDPPLNWNFEKILVGRDGRPISRWGTQTSPAALKTAIEQALATGAPERHEL
jgi:glutathione peroxidase